MMVHIRHPEGKRYLFHSWFPVRQRIIRVLLHVLSSSPNQNEGGRGGMVAANVNSSPPFFMAGPFLEAICWTIRRRELVHFFQRSF